MRRKPAGVDCASAAGMVDINSFRDLVVWQKSMDLAERCYRLSKRFPREDQMVLGHQIRKCAVSIPSNVAEGHERHYTSVYIQHLWIAHASGAELETQLELGRRVEIVSEDQASRLIADAQEIGRMIHGLVRSLERTR
jgi:four helix bundle protein